MKNMQLMMAQMERNMKATFEKSIEEAMAKTAGKMEELKADLGGRMQAAEKGLGRLEERQKKAEGKVESLAADLAKRETGLAGMVRNLVREQLANQNDREDHARTPRDNDLGGRPPRPLGRPNPLAHDRNGGEDRSEEAYWNTRMALQLYPITGEDKHRAVSHFMTEHLGLAREELLDLDFKVVPLPQRPPNAIQHVARVYFNTIEQRDMIRRRAKNLAGKEQGIRIEIPFHLRKNNRILQGLALALKKRNPGLKRNVRLNDEPSTAWSRGVLNRTRRQE